MVGGGGGVHPGKLWDTSNSKDASKSWTATIGTPAAVPAIVSATSEKPEAARTPI
jgi:hypothetical protein